MISLLRIDADRPNERLSLRGSWLRGEWRRIDVDGCAGELSVAWALPHRRSSLSIALRELESVRFRCMREDDGPHEITLLLAHRHAGDRRMERRLRFCVKGVDCDEEARNFVFRFANALGWGFHRLRRHDAGELDVELFPSEGEISYRRAESASLQATPATEAAADYTSQAEPVAALPTATPAPVAERRYPPPSPREEPPPRLSSQMVVEHWAPGDVVRFHQKAKSNGLLTTLILLVKLPFISFFGVMIGLVVGGLSGGLIAVAALLLAKLLPLGLEQTATAWLQENIWLGTPLILMTVAAIVTAQYVREQLQGAYDRTVELDWGTRALTSRLWFLQRRIPFERVRAVRLVRRSTGGKSSVRVHWVRLEIDVAGADVFVLETSASRDDERGYQEAHPMLVALSRGLDVPGKVEDGW